VLDAKLLQRTCKTRDAVSNLAPCSAAIAVDGGYCLRAGLQRTAQALRKFMAFPLDTADAVRISVERS
jgi:hypothetical protein